jgi:hypothetical protein
VLGKQLVCQGAAISRSHYIGLWGKKTDEQSGEERGRSNRKVFMLVTWGALSEGLEHVKARGIVVKASSPRSLIRAWRRRAT